MNLELVNTAAPTSIEGEPLNPSSLHDWLALPIQHFIEKHPEKSREDLIVEVCEVVAELVSSCGTDWTELRSYRHLAIDALHEQFRAKFAAHDRMRRNRS